VGRFLSEDSAKASFHFYGYVENAPVLYVDPTGMVSVSKSSSRGLMRYDDSGVKCRQPSARALGCALMDVSTRCRCTEACTGSGWRAKISISAQITVYASKDCKVSVDKIFRQEQLHVNWFKFIMRDLESAARLVEAVRYSSKKTCEMGCGAFNGVFRVDKVSSLVAAGLTDFFLHDLGTCW